MDVGGAVDLIRRLSTASQNGRIDHALFGYFFLSTYSGRIESLLEERGISPTFQFELRELLDPKSFIGSLKTEINQRIDRLEGRIKQSKGGTLLADKLKRAGTPFHELLRQIEKQYPYQMNYYKPYSTLGRELGEEQIMWELEVGNDKRIEMLWNPLLEILRKIEAVVFHFQ